MGDGRDLLGGQCGANRQATGPPRPRDAACVALLQPSSSGCERPAVSCPGPVLAQAAGNGPQPSSMSFRGSPLALASPGPVCLASAPWPELESFIAGRSSAPPSCFETQTGADVEMRWMTRLEREADCGGRSLRWQFHGPLSRPPGPDAPVCGRAAVAIRGVRAQPGRGGGQSPFPWHGRQPRPRDQRRSHHAAGLGDLPRASSPATMPPSMPR